MNKRKLKTTKKQNCKRDNKKKLLPSNKMYIKKIYPGLVISISVNSKVIRKNNLYDTGKQFYLSKK